MGVDAFEKALDEYYSLRGWDTEGVPSEKTLTELNIDVRLPVAPDGRG
jgi:aldehyde:ferredoxin oxidoreductase